MLDEKSFSGAGEKRILVGLPLESEREGRTHLSEEKLRRSSGRNGKSFRKEAERSSIRNVAWLIKGKITTLGGGGTKRKTVTKISPLR